MKTGILVANLISFSCIILRFDLYSFSCSVSFFLSAAEGKPSFAFLFFRKN
jgi:hypothetical protein